MRSRAQAQTAATPTLREASRFFVRLLLLARPYWSGLAKGIMLGLFVGVFGLASPYFSKLYFDAVYPAHDVSLMHLLVYGAAAFSLTSALSGGIRSYYSTVISAKLGNAVGLMYFNHLQHLPLQFFDEHRVGEVLSRLGDVRGALGAVARIFQTILVNGVYLVLVPPLLLMLNWKLAFVSLIMTPITVVITTATSRIVRRFMKESAETSAELGAIQTEVLSQIRTLKTLGAEHHVFRHASEQAEDVLRAQLKTAGMGTGVGIVNAGIRATGTAIFTWYAWTLILNGQLSLGSFVAFGGYLGFLTGPVSALTGLFADFQQTAVTLGRAFEYLDLEPEQNPELAYHPPAAIVHRLRGEIGICGVSFAYNADRQILQDVTFEVPAGSVLAIVGPSGAGKSTVLRLLCRLGHASAGVVRIDGMDISSIPLAELRRQVAVVWQEPTMLRGTILENLTFGLESVGRDRVEEVVQVCQLDELVGSLPSGYDTAVAEWGATVSGGQRQRFALARALLRNAPILLLDEATSQVDVRTEAKVLHDVLRRVRDRTVIMVTHRMATATLADAICVLDAGRVVGLGSHAMLAKSCATFSQLLQSGSKSDDQSFNLHVVGMKA